MASDINYVDLIQWNRERLSEEEVLTIQRHIGLKPDGIFGPKTLDAVITFQRDNLLIADGKVGRQTLNLIYEQREGKGAVNTVVALDAAELGKIVEITILHESTGKRNPYAAQNRDLEFEGYFDRPTKTASGEPIPRSERPKRHWASKYKKDSKGVHIGLSWGCIQFTQDGGALGAVLAKANELDRDLFVKIMGEGDAKLADRLLAVVCNPSTTRNAYTDGSRRARVMPVDGADLWQAPWTQRFDRAAEQPVFQLAQRIIAATDYLFPAIQLVRLLGAKQISQEDLAVAFDMCVHMGPGPLPRVHPFSDMGYQPVSSGKGASKHWCKAANVYKRGVIASEVVKLMAASERARRQKIMNVTDERRCYDRDVLYALTRKDIATLLASL